LQGKRKRKDVAAFSLYFMDNILALHKELAQKTYLHGGYQAFKISDPKPRDIHKASVRDRLVHHAICRVLYPYFDREFIFDSYSCRIGKGTHRAISRFYSFGRTISKNNTRTCWILKGDIRKFFASIDHKILKQILANYIADKDVLWLLVQVIDSFCTEDKTEIGLPLGNFTSQLFVNIYLNKFDQFIKRNLKVKHYARYCDDFIIMHEDKSYLENIKPQISEFLETELNLLLHTTKVFVKTFSSGIDFLGWINFPHYRVLRTSTRRKILKRSNRNLTFEAIASYSGLLLHGNVYGLSAKIKKLSSLA